jgi:hypothetical protein
MYITRSLIWTGFTPKRILLRAPSSVFRLCISTYLLCGALCPGVKHGRSVMLTTHPLLVPRLRKSRSYTSCHPDAPLWSVTGPRYLYIFIVYIEFWKARSYELESTRKWSWPILMHNNKIILNETWYHSKDVNLLPDKNKTKRRGTSVFVCS